MLHQRRASTLALHTCSTDIRHKFQELTSTSGWINSSDSNLRHPVHAKGPQTVPGGKHWKLQAVQRIGGKENNLKKNKQPQNSSLHILKGEGLIQF